MRAAMLVVVVIGFALKPDGERPFEKQGHQSAPLAPNCWRTVKAPRRGRQQARRRVFRGRGASSSAMPTWWSCSRQREGKGNLGRPAYCLSRKCSHLGPLYLDWPSLPSFGDRERRVPLLPPTRIALAAKSCALAGRHQ